MGGAVSGFLGGSKPSVKQVVQEKPAAAKAEAEENQDDIVTGGGKASLKKKSAYAASLEEQGDQTKKPLYRGSIYGQKKLSS